MVTLSIMICSSFFNQQTPSSYNAFYLNCYCLSQNVISLRFEVVEPDATYGTRILMIKRIGAGVFFQYKFRRCLCLVVSTHCFGNNVHQLAMVSLRSLHSDWATFVQLLWYHHRTPSKLSGLWPTIPTVITRIEIVVYFTHIKTEGHRHIFEHTI